MRSERHRRETLNALADAWARYPELRLSQLIWNAVGQEGVSVPDFFHMTDGEFRGGMNRYHPSRRGGDE